LLSKKDGPTNGRRTLSLPGRTQSECLFAGNVTSVTRNSHMMMLNMKASLSSVTSVHFYQTTRRNISEDSILQVFYRLGVLGLRSQGPSHHHTLWIGYRCKAEYECVWKRLKCGTVCHRNSVLISFENLVLYLCVWVSIISRV
jgi:hypothetical protein